MLIPPNRRARERRQDPRVDEPLQRKSDRRAEDRRDSERPMRKIFVRSSLAPLPIQHVASLSLEGVTWVTGQGPSEDTVEVLLRLPDMPDELTVPSRIMRRRPLGDGQVEIYAAFAALDLKAELSIARFIETRTQLRAATRDLQSFAHR